MRKRQVVAGKESCYVGPHAIWLMMPAAAVDSTLDEIVPLVTRDDVIIDGGNSYYHDDIRRAKALAANGIHYVDVGTSGGVWGFECGYGSLPVHEAPGVAATSLRPDCCSPICRTQSTSPTVWCLEQDPCGWSCVRRCTSAGTKPQ